MTSTGVDPGTLRPVGRDVYPPHSLATFQEALMPDVHLDSDEVDLVIGGQEVRLPCDVVLRSEPTGPEVTFRVSNAPLELGIRVLLGAAASYSLRFVKAAVQCEVFRQGGGAGSDQVLEFRPYRDPVIVGGDEKLCHMRFDLINFPRFNAAQGEDRLDIAGAEWCIDICPPRDSPDVEALRSPFYWVTHSCTVCRADGTAFSSDVVWELLSVLQDALSFAAGRWVGTAFATGVGTDGGVVWKCWGVGRLHPRLSEDGTWFDHYHGNSLDALLSGALNLARSKQRYETFHAAVYWYVRSGSSRGGVDGGLILLQACLERLGWQRFVIDRAVCPDGRFESLKGGHRLRCLLRDCSIPVTIPPKLAQLVREAAARGWDDGPRAV